MGNARASDSPAVNQSNGAQQAAHAANGAAAAVAAMAGQIDYQSNEYKIESSTNEAVDCLIAAPYPSLMPVWKPLVQITR